ncbi:unnamed protein product [Auanema sp. JU1783]|nr:unnamed protein product [Auanema sp. JU1783]
MSSNRLSSFSENDIKAQNDKLPHNNMMRTKNFDLSGHFVKLVHAKGFEKVSLTQLCEVSQAIRDHVEDQNCPDVIKLSNFSESSVEYICGYIRGKALKESMTYSMLGELIRLCKLLRLPELLKKLEEQLYESCKSPENIIETLIVLSLESVSEQMETSIYKVASEKFMDIVMHPAFVSIPPSQLIILFSSCYIKVERELVIVDSILCWLKEQETPEYFATLLLSTVRTNKLTNTDIEVILERIKLLALPEIILSQAERIFSSDHGKRMCLLEQHVTGKLVRCGTDNHNTMNGINTMPLSVRNGERKIGKNEEWFNKNVTSKSKLAKEVLSE